MAELTAELLTFDQTLPVIVRVTERTVTFKIAEEARCGGTAYNPSPAEAAEAEAG